MTDWSADPWFAEHAWVAPRVGETRRSGFKSLRPHALSFGPLPGLADVLDHTVQVAKNRHPEELGWVIGGSRSSRLGGALPPVRLAFHVARTRFLRRVYR